MRCRLVIVIALSAMCLPLANCGNDKSSNPACLTEIAGATEFRSGIWRIDDTTSSCVPLSRPYPYPTKSDTFCVDGADFYYRYFDDVWQALGEKWPNLSNIAIEAECISGEVSDSTFDLTWSGQFAGTPDCVELAGC